MSKYDLLPSPQEAELWAWMDKEFSESECYQIREIGEKLLPQDATVGNNQIDPAVRRSKTSWISSTPETVWIYDRLGYIVRMLNGRFFQFDITGFHEDLQYTVYESNVEGNYEAHIDSGMSGRNTPPRKLSLSLQLSHPDEYEGGDLELITGTVPTKTKREQGVVIAFPSYTLHRVTPVTKGTRRSLVVWLTGPRFR